MANYDAIDVAKYVINHEIDMSRNISNLRLQKLLYFVQAKFLCEVGEPCFVDDIEAWQFGPVVPSVYYAFKSYAGLDIFDRQFGGNISAKDSAIINNIIDYCASYPTFQLVEITHAQLPWINARRNIMSNIITQESIKNYFMRDKSEQPG